MVTPRPIQGRTLDILRNLRPFNGGEIHDDLIWDRIRKKHPKKQTKVGEINIYPGWMHMSVRSRVFVGGEVTTNPVLQLGNGWVVDE